MPLLLSWLGLVSSTTVLLLLYQWFQPRVPQYTLRVTRSSWPTIWRMPIQNDNDNHHQINIKKNIRNHWLWSMVQLSSDISMYNDNVVPIHVHAMSFDLFYPTWDGLSLIHVGHVMDHQQVQRQVLIQNQQQEKYPCYYYNGGTLKCANDDDDDDDHDDDVDANHGNDDDEHHVRQCPNQSTRRRRRKQYRKRSQPSSTPTPLLLWSLSAKSNFTIHDHLYLSLSNLSSSWSTILYHVMGQVIWNLLWHQATTLVVPSTGVLYIQATPMSSSSSSSSANKKNSSTSRTSSRGDRHPVGSHPLASLVPRMMTLPLTLGIVCDNLVELFWYSGSMQVNGLDCIMDSIDLGWWPMERQVSTLRHVAMNEWIPHVPPPRSTSNTTFTRNSTNRTIITNDTHPYQYYNHTPNTTSRRIPKEKRNSALTATLPNHHHNQIIRVTPRHRIYPRGSIIQRRKRRRNQNKKVDNSNKE